jgi:hypothetical protein
LLATKNDYLPQLEKHRVKSRTKQGNRQQTANKQFPKKANTGGRQQPKMELCSAGIPTNEISFGLKLLCKVNQLPRSQKSYPSSKQYKAGKKTGTRGIVRNNFLKTDALQAAKIGIKGH